MQQRIFKTGVHDRLDSSTFQTYTLTYASIIKRWWRMRQMCYRVAASHFQNSGAGPSGLNYVWNLSTLRHSPHSWKRGGGCEKCVLTLQGPIFKIRVQDRIDKTTFKKVCSGTLFSFTKSWWWVREMCSRTAAFHFKNSVPWSSGLN
jgi:hypothetical protein